MASNPATELASTIQSTHIEQNPDPNYDLNPSTAASISEPVRLRSHVHQPFAFPPLPAESKDGPAVPASLLHQPPRKTSLPPLPDLRFEQSYLASLSKAQSNWGVAWITTRDQVLMPLLQGLGWNLILHGWKAWNVASKFHGQDVGAKLRRWWWGVNGWKLPTKEL